MNEKRTALRTVAPLGLCFVMGALATTARAQEPTATVILERALERAAVQQESGAELDHEYLVSSIVKSLDGDGRVTDTERVKYRRYPLEGLLYEELVERDGQPLDADDAREEQKKKAEFVRDVREYAARGEPYEPDENAVRFDRELMDRYHTTLVGSERLRNHECWVLHFEPREGRLPDTRRMDKALNRLTGRLWVAKDDYGVARVTFEMREPFRYLWGLVATLRNGAGHIDFNRIDDSVWTPMYFDLRLDLRVFFKGVRRHITSTWETIPPGAHLATFHAKDDG